MSAGGQKCVNVLSISLSLCRLQDQLLLCSGPASLTPLSCVRVPFWCFFIFEPLRIVFVFVAYFFTFHIFHAIAAFSSSATGEGHLFPHHLSLDDSSVYP